MNEHYLLHDDFHASYASCLKDILFKDGLGILDWLQRRKQGLLCLSIELERKGRVFGGISSGLE
jgi:hypothetical protein